MKYVDFVTKNDYFKDGGKTCVDYFNKCVI